MNSSGHPLLDQRLTSLPTSHHESGWPIELATIHSLFRHGTSSFFSLPSGSTPFWYATIPNPGFNILITCIPHPFTLSLITFLSQYLYQQSIDKRFSKHTWLWWTSSTLSTLVPPDGLIGLLPSLTQTQISNQNHYIYSGCRSPPFLCPLLGSWWCWKNWDSPLAGHPNAMELSTRPYPIVKGVRCCFESSDSITES